MIIPAGTYSINQTLLIGSGTTLQADPNAVIRLANGANTLLINNRANASNVTLQGGIWDGNNQYNVRGADSDPNAYCGAAINFFGVTGLSISDLTVRNPNAFSVRLGNVDTFTVRNISLAFPVARLNQDGIHVAGNSHNGLISGIKAISANTPNDDMVALNADDSTTRSLTRGLQNGPISNVVVANLRADNAYSFVRLYSNTSLLQNVTIRNIKGGVRNGAIVMSNHDFPVGAGDIRNVTIDDCTFTKTTTGVPVVNIGLNAHNVHFTNVVRNDSINASTLVPRNNVNNIIRFADGSQQQVQHYAVATGGLSDFWLTPATMPEPSCYALLATGILAIAVYCLKNIGKVGGYCESCSNCGMVNFAHRMNRLDGNAESGDVVELDLPMAVMRIEAHPAVVADHGEVAIQRGPIVYALEGLDNDGQALISLPFDPQFQIEHRPELLGGVTVIRGKTVDDKPFVAIPFYALANRANSQQEVWLQQAEKSERDGGWEGKLYREYLP